MSSQSELALIDHTIDNRVVQQRALDGYINATAMCTAAGKLFADYYRLKTTRAFLAELDADMGIPISVLVQRVKGGQADQQGSWVHPLVRLIWPSGCRPRSPSELRSGSSNG